MNQNLIYISYFQNKYHTSSNTIKIIMNELNIYGIKNKKGLTVSEKEKIIIENFIESNQPITHWINNYSKKKSINNNYLLTDFIKLTNWDRSRVINCLKFLKIYPIEIKSKMSIYSKESYDYFYKFITDKFNSFSSEYISKSEICKKENLNWETFDTTIKKLNIKSIFDWGFGKDRFYFDKKSVDKIHNYIKETKENNSKGYTVKELTVIFNKRKTTINKTLKELNIPFLKGDFNKSIIDENSFTILQDYFYKTEISGKSYKEKEIVEFIKSICDFEIIENSRDIICPKELDIYIPSKKVAIEFDGLYWHNELRVDKYYHLNKTKLCNEKGIDLIHIFEDDWIYKKEIVKSMIASRLGIYKEKIFARKCIIKEVDKNTSELFLNENHLQGYASTSDINLGLFYNDELVQLISITLKGFHDGNTELTRMATKLNTQVIGGFSKLIKNFCKLYNINSIVSYIYKAWFNGKSYKECGFEVIKENPPNYYYIVKNKRIHKSKFRKNRIKKLYNDGILNYWNENETEKELMKKNNIYKIYDCGTVKVIYI